MRLNLSNIQDAREIIAQDYEENRPVIDWTDLHNLCGRLQIAINRSAFADGAVTISTKATRYPEFGVGDPEFTVVNVRLHCDENWIYNIAPRLNLYLDRDEPIEAQLTEEIRRTGRAWLEFADTVEAILSTDDPDRRPLVFRRVP